MASNRSRSQLHASKLKDYKQFCETQGWTEESPKSFFEVLRMRHSESKKLLIVYRTAAPNLVHFTIWGESARLFKDFMRSKKEAEK